MFWESLFCSCCVLGAGTLIWKTIHRVTGFPEHPQASPLTSLCCVTVTDHYIFFYTVMVMTLGRRAASSCVQANTESSWPGAALPSCQALCHPACDRAEQELERDSYPSSITHHSFHVISKIQQLHFWTRNSNNCMSEPEKQTRFEFPLFS